MHIRWQARKRRRPAYGGYGRLLRSGRDFAYARKGRSEQDVHWGAVLVEDERIDGKPKRRHVAYLGGITASAITFIHQRAWFWDDVKKKLDQLGKRVSAEDRKRIEAAVAKKVPRVSKERYDKCVRSARELFGPDWKPR